MTLGLVIPDNSNPFFAELARCIEEVGFEYGYTLLLGNAMDDDDREARYVRALLDRQVDGMILVPAHGARTWIAELSQTPVPRLVLDREIAIPHATQVLVDNEQDAHIATTHLISHGHGRVGCIAGLADVHPSIDRIRGWRRALTEAGFDPTQSPLVHIPFGTEPAYAAARQLLAGPNKPEALFVTSDQQAVGVLRAAVELGVRIPDDLAICSFDGIEASAYTVPALTTMRQPFEDLGRAAVEWMVRRMGDPSLAPTRIVLPSRLITRGSCGCPDPVGGDQDAEVPA